MRALAGWALVGLALLAHAGGLANGFVYDDHRFVVANPALAEIGWREALLDPATHTADDDRDVYRPLRALSHAADRARWGLDPFGFHLHSVLLHVACVLLAALALRRLLPPPHAPAAWFGAALLAVHPVGVEAVGWVSSRGDQQALALGLLALLAAGLRPRALALPAAALLAGAATLGKESAAVLPAVALLHELVRRRAAGPRPARLGMDGAAALAAGVTAALVLRQVALAGASPVQTPPHGGSLLAQAGWALFGLGTSAWHVLWPAGLSVDYPTHAWAAAGAALLQLPGLAGLALVLGLGALGWRVLRRPARSGATHGGAHDAHVIDAGGAPLAPWLLVLLGWAALAYLPSSSLLVTLRELVNDRALLPCLAPLGAALALAARRALPGGPWTRRALAAALLGMLLLAARERTRDFRSDAELWRATLRVHPASAAAHLGLARAALDAGDVQPALELLARGARRAPRGSKQHAELLAHWGDALLRHAGDAAHARAVLAEALVAVRAWDAREHPSLVGDATAASLAEALVVLGRPHEALALLDAERARAARPEQLDLKRAVLLRGLVEQHGPEPWLAELDHTLERVTRVLPHHPLVRGLAIWRAERSRGAVPGARDG